MPSLLPPIDARTAQGHPMRKDLQLNLTIEQTEEKPFPTPTDPTSYHHSSKGTSLHAIGHCTHSGGGLVMRHTESTASRFRHSLHRENPGRVRSNTDGLAATAPLIHEHPLACHQMQMAKEETRKTGGHGGSFRGFRQQLAR